MGKWLGGIVTTLVILAMTSALGAWLKGPIDDWVSRDRLQAEVQLAPWYARPAAAEAKQASSTSDDVLNNALAKLRLEAADISTYGVARVTLSNESSNLVTHVNFRLLAPMSAEDAIVVDAQGKTRSLHDVNRISLPDMNPGDKAIVYLWGNFSSYLFPENFRTYSSAGRFRVGFDWPTAQDRAYESGIGRFLDDYAGWAVVVSIAIITLLFGVLAAVYNSYYKLLLKNEEHYHSERTRYLANPEKFEPKTTVSGVTVLEPASQHPASAP